MLYRLRVQYAWIMKIFGEATFAAFVMHSTRLQVSQESEKFNGTTIKVNCRYLNISA